jgi:hypothetical protein
MDGLDESLVAAHLRGDPAAFRELVRRYGDGVLGYLFRMTAVETRPKTSSGDLQTGPRESPHLPGRELQLAVHHRHPSAIDTARRRKRTVLFVTGTPIARGRSSPLETS